MKFKLPATACLLLIQVIMYILQDNFLQNTRA